MCQMFKGLVAFGVLAILASLGMVVVAVLVRKKGAKREGPDGKHLYEPALNPGNPVAAVPRIHVDTEYKGAGEGKAESLYGTKQEPAPPAYDNPDDVGKRRPGEAATYYG